MSKRFECPSCGYAACKTCQKTYLLPSCMSCRAEFTQRHMIDGLGATFVSTVLRRHQERLLMEHEKSQLPAMQGFVDSVRAQRETASRARYGTGTDGGQESDGALRARVRAAAASARVRALTLRCPAEDCRGYVDTTRVDRWWACGLCRQEVCAACHLAVGPTEDRDHSCNPDDVTSIALLRSDSRSCPQCSVSIFRTEGCSHMHCTFCGADFNWDSGRLIRTTTNHHYNGVSNISASVSASVVQDQDHHVEDQVEDQDQDQELDAVPRDAQDPARADPELMGALYDDLAVVRFTRGSVFRDSASYDASLTDLRVRFLLSEIDEPRWTRRVFAIAKSRRRCHHLTRVLDLYISTARDFQRLQFRIVVPGREESTALKGAWLAFVAACNASLLSLHGEYGGARLVLRVRLDDPDQPPLLMQ